MSAMLSSKNWPNFLLSCKGFKFWLDNILIKNQESWAGSVIYATEMLEFEDSPKLEELVQGWKEPSDGLYCTWDRYYH